MKTKSGIRVLRFVVAGVTSVTGGCFTATTPVTMTMRQEAAKNWYFPKLRLIEGEHEARDIDKDDPGARAAIKDRLEKAFYADGNFARAVADGPDVLTAQYRILYFGGGDRGKRFVTSGVSRDGDGAIIIEATFQHPGGTTLAKMEARAAVLFGTWGGNLSATYDRVARDINIYARNHFLDSRQKR